LKRSSILSEWGHKKCWITCFCVSNFTLSQPYLEYSTEHSRTMNRRAKQVCSGLNRRRVLIACAPVAADYSTKNWQGIHS
jgi:hypothetical protein